MPLVSVILTCYNGEKWIERAIDSVLQQTYQDFELIIIDDNSQDNSKYIISDYVSKNDKVKAYYHEINQGIPVTKNKGIKISQGKYIAFIEQDDEWSSTKLEEQVKVMNSNEDVGLVFTNVTFINKNNKLKSSISKKEVSGTYKEVLKKFFLQNRIPTMSAVMLRRKCFDELGLFSREFYGADDYEFWLRLVASYKIKLLLPCLVKKYETGVTSSLMGAKKMLEDRVKIINSFATKYDFLNILKNRRLANIFFSYALINYLNKNDKETKKYLKKALKYDWSLLKVYPMYLITISGKIGRYLFEKIVEYYKPESRCFLS